MTALFYFQPVIEFSRFTLPNGLRVLVHTDDSTPMAALNVLYLVGSRDESPDRTGLAHLFEHLMFGGSAHIPDFDTPLQLAGGENNAFTNNDITNFYITLPTNNLEVAFWLESDRMLRLNFNKKVLSVQRKVVVEEFKETCLNEPYGDYLHHLSEMAYQRHPYQWPTIGKKPEHIAETRLDEIEDFFYKHYRPNNAILVVTGNVQEAEVKELAEKWFGDIPAGDIPQRQLSPEPPQSQLRRRLVEAKVPGDAIFLAFHSPGRMDPAYYASELLADILGNGRSSRLYRKLVKEMELFTNVEAYLTSTIDPGLLIVEGRPTPGTSLDQARAAIWQELDTLKTEGVTDVEVARLRHKAESALIFSEMSILNKGINLAFFEALGEPELINREAALYSQVTAADLQQLAHEMLREENCSELCYRALPQLEEEE